MEEGIGIRPWCFSWRTASWTHQGRFYTEKLWINLAVNAIEDFCFFRGGSVVEIQRFRRRRHRWCVTVDVIGLAILEMFYSPAPGSQRRNAASFLWSLSLN